MYDMLTYSVNAQILCECTKAFVFRTGLYRPLQMLAQRIFSICANSASCERLFSLFGLILSKLRSRLALEKCLILQSLGYICETSTCGGEVLKIGFVVLGISFLTRSPLSTRITSTSSNEITPRSCQKPEILTCIVTKTH